MLLPLLAAVALAQDAPSVCFHRGPILTNAQVLGMGGASVAASGGADGGLINPAAFASVDQPESLRFDALLALQSLPAKELVLGRTLGDEDPVLLLNPVLTLSKGSLGVGASLQGHGYRDPESGDALRSWLAGAGGALSDGRFTVGAQLLLHQASWLRADARSVTHGTGVELGLRWRTPTGSLSLGASGRTPIRAVSTDVDLHVLVPAELALGVATDQALMERPVRLAADLVITAPADGVIPASLFLRDPDGPEVSDPQASLSPRLGASWEAIEEQIRLRAGGYWEPGWVDPGRLHGTAGVDWSPPLPWASPPWTEPGWYRRARVTAGLDMANGYRRVALSVGLF